MTMITPSYLGETIEYSSLHACRSTLEDPTLGAVEADYPTIRLSRSRQLRGWARELGLVVSGGSDCHGPDPPRRAVGVCGVSAEELDELRQIARNAWSD